MSSKASEVDADCNYHTEPVFASIGIVCFNAILIFCVLVLFSYKSIKFMQTQKEANNPVRKRTRYFIMYCILALISPICSHISLLWTIIICLSDNDKYFNIGVTVHGITMLMCGFCAASMFVIRLQFVFENTMFAIKKSTLNLLYFGLALIVICGVFGCILLNIHPTIGFLIGTITFGVYIFICITIMKLFVQGLIDVVTFGLNGKSATTDAEKKLLLANMSQQTQNLIELMSKFSILVLICLISTSISLIAFGLRSLLIVIFNGNQHVTEFSAIIHNIMYSTDLLINSICLTFQFHYFYDHIYDKYCSKMHNSCKNIVINHVFNNTSKQSSSAKVTAV